IFRKTVAVRLRNWEENQRAVFLGLVFVSAQSQVVFQTCSFAEASPRVQAGPATKILAPQRLQFFFKRSDRFRQNHFFFLKYQYVASVEAIMQTVATG